MNKMTFDIATASSRMAKNWKQERWSWEQLAARLKDATVTAETAEEYAHMTKEQRSTIKDVGGFVGAYLEGGVRKATTVRHRQLVTLDIDEPRNDTWQAFALLYDCAAVMYSTHSSTPRQPRYRLVIPLDRPVDCEAYEAIARRVAQEVDLEGTDDTTYQPHRLMYWPSVSKDNIYNYIYYAQDGPALCADEVLSTYVDWHNRAEWPTSSRMAEAVKHLAKMQGSPTDKPGIVGAFCRTYDIDEAIAAFLPDKYVPCEGLAGRYTYTGGTTSAGLVVYDNGAFAYSHHSTDPCCSHLCNSFDLVRLHLYADRDEAAPAGTPVNRLPSYTAMAALALGDSNVKKTQLTERMREAGADFAGVADEAWLEQLDTDKYGRPRSTVHNAETIIANDPQLCSIRRNAFTRIDEIADRVPWRTPKVEGEHYWTNADNDALLCYLSADPYTFEGKDKALSALNAVLQKRAYHPVRDYLRALKWDGVARLDTLVIDYLGADDTPLTRAMTRKHFCAAVARIMQPGTKYDYVLTLIGREGIGKSTLIARMGRQWFTDSFTTVEGKDAMEQLQGKWLIEQGELTNYKRSTVEAYKAFLSKQEDSYRPAYGRNTERYPRQCVFFATTNESYFLKGFTGNRRFWPITVGTQDATRNVWRDLTPEVVGQLWAEALSLYESEPLYLSAEQEEEVRELQAAHSETAEDDRIGVIQDFLRIPLPVDWGSRSVEARRLFFVNKDALTEAGAVARTLVSAVEVLVECFGERVDEKTRYRTREINALLEEMGLEPYGRNYQGPYGRQRCWKVKLE